LEGPPHPGERGDGRRRAPGPRRGRLDARGDRGGHRGAARARVADGAAAVRGDAGRPGRPRQRARGARPTGAAVGPAGGGRGARHRAGGGLVRAPLGRRQVPRPGHLPAAGRPAARLPPAAPGLGGLERRVDAHRHPALPGAAGGDGHQAGVGLRHPAVQRPVHRLVGDGGPDRPGRPGDLVGDAAVRRLHPRQPAARRRTEGAGGAVAVPAQLAALREPPLHPAGERPGIRLPRRARPAADPVAQVQVAGAGRQGRPDRAQPDLGGEAGRPADHLRLRPDAGARDEPG